MSIGTLTFPNTPWRAGLRSPVLGPLIVAAAYYLGAEIAFAIGTLTQQFAPFWPPNVVLLCAFLVVPQRWWPLYIAAAFPAHILVEQGAGMPLVQLVGAFASNVAVSLLNAVAIKRLLHGPSWLGSLRSAFLYLLFAVIINPAVVALGAALEPFLGGGGEVGEYWSYWWRWCLANSVANLTLTPVFLSLWPSLRTQGMTPTRKRFIEAALLGAGLIVASYFAFDTRPTAATKDFFPALFYLPVPLLLAAAVRFGSRGSSASVFLITMLVLVGSAQGGGIPGLPGQSVLSVQLFLGVVAVPALLVAALVEELQRLNRRLGDVLGGISDCYYTFDRDGVITAVNAKGAAWWGEGSADDLVGRNYWDVSGGKAPDTAWIRDSMESGAPARREMATANGRWAEIHVYPSPDSCSVFYHDVTERRLAELAANDTRDLLQSSLDALSARVAILDGDGNVLAINAGWRHVADLLADLGAGCLVGDNYIDQCARGWPHQRRIAAGLRELLQDKLSEFRCEYQSGVIQGQWFQMRGSRFGTGAATRIVVAHENITEVKTSETALHRLSGNLMRLQDEERRRIARDLHDSTAQNLLGATLGIGHALRIAPSLCDAAKASLDESRALIDESQQELRTVAYLLHPPMLDEAGLAATLRWFGEGFAKRTNIDVKIAIDANLGRLPPDTEAALFRVAQEALTNVHRHSGADTVRLGLNFGAESADCGTSRRVVMMISDNGKGMPQELTRPADATGHDHLPPQTVGIGLTGMRERLFQLRGDLEILSGKHGTTIHASIPAPVDGAGERYSAI